LQTLTQSGKKFSSIPSAKCAGNPSLIDQCIILTHITAEDLPDRGKLQEFEAEIRAKREIISGYWIPKTSNLWPRRRRKLQDGEREMLSMSRGQGME